MNDTDSGVRIEPYKMEDNTLEKYLLNRSHRYLQMVAPVRTEFLQE